MPVLGSQPDVADFLKEYPLSIPKPSCVLVVSAHWLTEGSIKVTASQKHPLLFDYGGFPAESYAFKYDAPGSPDVASIICDSLTSAGIPCEKDYSRGWDHGVFVPLMLMYPDASIPVVEMSLNRNLDPKMHIEIGKALAPLRNQGILIVGSGASFHNFAYFFARDASKQKSGIQHSHIFQDFLVSTLVSPGKTAEEREELLIKWASSSPAAREAHPPGQEEHLIPLHVLFGAGMADPCMQVGLVKNKDELAFGNFEWQ
jgi:aromatic ring-opening dioxygenase catalytic subunit (LigB family)